MSKRLDFYEGKPSFSGQHCRKCAFARFTRDGNENLCQKTKRFGKPSRGKFCKHFIKKEYQKKSKSL